MKLPLAIRVDSSLKIGTGNIKRCMLLAQQLKKKNFKVYFIKTNSHYNNILKKLGFNFVVIKKQKYFEYKVLNFLNKKKIIAYYTDLLESEIKIEKIIMKNDLPVIIFEDEIKKHFCKIYFNPNLNISDNSLLKKKVISNKNFLGSKYYILNKIKKIKRKFDYKILISFGGSDNSNQTEKVIKAIKNIYNSNFKIFVCVGKNFKNKRKLYDKYKKIENLKFFSSEKLFNKLYLFDYIIGSCGQSLLERIYLKKFSLSAITSNNQYLLAKNIKKFNFTKIINLSFYPKKIKISHWRNEIINYLNMEKINNDGKIFLDTLGTERISKILKKLVNDKRIQNKQ